VSALADPKLTPHQREEALQRLAAGENPGRRCEDLQRQRHHDRTVAVIGSRIEYGAGSGALGVELYPFAPPTLFCQGRVRCRGEASKNVPTRYIEPCAGYFCAQGMLSIGRTVESNQKLIDRIAVEYPRSFGRL
jgi:hypothetical protein